MSFNVERFLDEQGPDYDEAVINLIDALHAYIRVDQETYEDFIREGAVFDKDQRRKIHAHLRRCHMLLGELEAINFGGWKGKNK